MAAAKRTLRAPKGSNEVDPHQIYFSISFADDAAEQPGQAVITVGLREEARKTKWRDSEGNDHYRQLYVKADAALLAMKLSDALDHLAALALEADENRAAELAAAKP